VVSVRELVNRFDHLEAVRGISFQVRLGETFAFPGPDGRADSQPHLELHQRAGLGVIVLAILFTSSVRRSDRLGSRTHPGDERRHAAPSLWPDRPRDRGSVASVDSPRRAWAEVCARRAAVTIRRAAFFASG
jgi:hypothetical protein